MCRFDRNTKQKLTDCGSCGCGQSTSWGYHKAVGRDGKCCACGLPVHSNRPD